MLLISGFTPQYKGLQKLHEDYKDRGLVVIGFPCDQFGGQEPGNDEEIMQVRITLVRICGSLIFSLTDL